MGNSYDVEVHELVEIKESLSLAGESVVFPAGMTHACVTANNTFLYFPDEESACAFQREWRSNSVLLCALCGEPFSAGFTVNDKDTARDLRIEIGDEVCACCYG